MYFFFFFTQKHQTFKYMQSFETCQKMIMIYASETKKQIFPISCETIIPCKYQLGLLDCDFLECIRNVKKINVSIAHSQ